MNTKTFNGTILDEMTVGQSITIIGEKQNGERNEVTLTRVDQSSEERQAKARDRMSSGPEWNYFRQSHVPMTTAYFMKDAVDRHYFRVSPELEVGQRFFDGVHWFETVESFEITTP